MRFPTAFVHQRALDSAVRSIEDSFSSQVVRIRHSFGEDSSGAPSIFFRVLVRDEAAPIVHLREFAQRISIALMDAARTDENGLHAYFDFRSVFEQARLRDPDWEWKIGYRQELLESAISLFQVTPRTQANLRRAVSSAYYAIFHF